MFGTRDPGFVAEAVQPHTSRSRHSRSAVAQKHRLRRSWAVVGRPPAPGRSAYPSWTADTRTVSGSVVLLLYSTVPQPPRCIRDRHLNFGGGGGTVSGAARLSGVQWGSPFRGYTFLFLNIHQEMWLFFFQRINIFYFHFLGCLSQINLTCWLNPSGVCLNDSTYSGI